MDRFKLSEIISQLIENDGNGYLKEHDSKIKEVVYDDCDGSLVLELWVNGKRKVFGIDVKEVI